MTREEFKDVAMKILLNEKFGNFGMLFNAEEMERYRIAQYDEADWDVEASMPLNDFLDELWKVAFNNDYNAEMKKWWDKRIEDCEDPYMKVED